MEEQQVQVQQLRSFKGRISLIIDDQNFQANNVEDEEKYLYEDRSWENQFNDITIEGIRKDELQRYKAEWNWGLFFEFLFYHLCYYIFLGPLMNLIFWYKPGMTLMRNMKFYGFAETTGLQTIIWVTSVVNGWFYLFFTGKYEEIVLLWYAISFRAVVIAAKYATFTEQKIKLYKTVELETKTFRFDLMMFDWRFQSSQILFLEQYRSLKRNQFEISQYKFEFIVPLHQETMKKIKETEITYFKDMGIVTNPQEYSGYQVIGFLIKKFQEIYHEDSFMLQSSIESVIISLVPLAANLYFYINEVTLGPLDYIRIITNFISTYNSMMGAYIFFHMGFYDFKRKFFLTYQCLYMIKLIPHKYEYPKLVPTLNINNKESLQAWAMFRSLTADYGQCFNLRTQGFYSLVFLGFIFLIIMSLLIILDYVVLNQFQLILFCSIAIYILAFMSYYLYLGAKFNSLFQEYEMALQEVKSIYLDFLRMKESYILQNIEPQSYLHKNFLNFLKKSINNDLTKMDSQIQDIIQEVDDNLRMLENDQRNHPFRLYGITITFNLLKSAVVGLSTIYSYAIQQRTMFT